MKRSHLSLLLAIALTLVAVPVLASDLPSPTRCAYAGPTSLSQPAPTGETTPELFAAPLTIHLGALDPLDPDMGSAKARALHVMGFSGGGVSDQQDCYVFTSSEQCGPWYRTGDCCSNPEANREAQRCTYNAVCDGVSSLITAYWYNCVGTICY